MMQEKYTAADVGGQRNSASFGGATATLAALCVTADGALRLGRTPPAGPGQGSGEPAYFVFKKLPDGELAAWLESKGLPASGGTAV